VPRCDETLSPPALWCLFLSSLLAEFEAELARLRAAEREATDPAHRRRIGERVRRCRRRIDLALSIPDTQDNWRILA
jgi:hypothetical protein